MKRRQYLNDVIRLCKNAAEIKRSAENPSKYMTRTHVLLHYVALKRLGNQTEK
jgi:ethanolamine utilization cobalamin adenosyltransferase